MKKKLTNEELKQINGGEDIPEVHVKTLDGENDDYQISLNDKISDLIDKYKSDKKSEKCTKTN